MKEKYAILNNGVQIPLVGFGTFKVENGQETVEAVKNALKSGYRHIDAAAIYNNEDSVGQGIKESGIDREEIFITSKVWNSDQGFDNTLKAFETTLEKLGMNYLDLYLIHWPQSLNKETWKALEKLYKDGKVRAIGVSNFKENHLKELMEEAEIFPMVNQVEFHPQLTQPELVTFCNENKIQIVAWGPLMQGQLDKYDLFNELSVKYNKTPAQIVLKWDIQQGIVTIPKSTNLERIKSNFEIFDFNLDKEDMEKISNLNTGVRIGLDPDDVYV